MLSLGPITAAHLGLERMLLESPNFLRWSGARTRPEARRRIKHYDYEDDPVRLIQERPFAVILTPAQAVLTAVSWGNQVEFTPSGGISLILTDRDDAGSERRAGYLRFAGWLDLILEDLRERSAVEDRLPISRIDLLWPILHSPMKDEASAGAYWHVCVNLEIGK